MGPPTIERYLSVRGATEALAAHLSPEDQQLQSMPACSPTKWHRAHTTWFFETFVLARPVRPEWSFLFNSYYEAVGPRVARERRGLLSRPTADEVGRWRAEVDDRMVALLPDAAPAVGALAELGLQHEQQHQELILTDILHAFSQHPARPAYCERASFAPVEHAGWTEHPGGVVEIGHAGDGFSFDNELPRHEVLLRPFALMGRPVTLGEWRAFAREGGYRTPSLWLSDGFEFVRSNRIEAPLHTRLEGDAVVVFDLDGERERDLDEPVRHLSFYEADALARFLGARLPTEAEWEAAHPAATGHVWEWTGSAYSPYPGFRPAPGAVGEYNGKFMVNQLVLRGGSRFTPPGHVRPSYRNFWHPDTRFQVTGLRLARDLE